MPKAKSWNIALQRAERSPELMHSVCTDHFHSVSHPKPFRPSAPLLAQAPWACCCQRTAEGVPQHTAGQPSHSDYLPLFQWGSAPVSMTTWSLCCSVGLDIQSVAGEGCRGATQQMHFSQQDALLLPGTAWTPVRQHRRWWEPPWFLFCCFFRLVSVSAHFRDNLSLLSPWLPDR